MTSYLVTAATCSSTVPSSWSRIWNGKSPLRLGLTSHWIIKKTTGAINITNTVTKDVRDIPLIEIQSTKEILLQSACPIKLAIKPARTIAPLPPHLIKPTTTYQQLEKNEQKYFKKALKASAICLAAFSLVTWIWPKPAIYEEIIPPQLTKIILTPSAGNNHQIAAQNTAKERSNSLKKTLAFQQKTIQNSINGLLNGGMTLLLSKSNPIGPGSSHAARRTMDTKSSGIIPTTTEVIQNNHARNTNIAMLGGTLENSGASRVGYTTGARASVAGQGKSQIAFDTVNSIVEEGLTKDEVGQTIHRHLKEIRYCYEAAILRNPATEGRLIINFIISGSGGIRSSQVKTSTVSDTGLDNCIIQRLTAWRFPQTKGGIDVAVSYPFIFKMLGR
ncbi:MAG: AgmX/PglI C-terminal domain-containing protein [Bdellovibrionota bacterium]